MKGLEPFDPNLLSVRSTSTAPLIFLAGLGDRIRLIACRGKIRGMQRTTERAAPQQQLYRIPPLYREHEGNNATVHPEQNQLDLHGIREEARNERRSCLASKHRITDNIIIRANQIARAVAHANQTTREEEESLCLGLRSLWLKRK